MSRRSIAETVAVFGLGVVVSALWLGRGRRGDATDEANARRAA